jgi:hypothetical protein
MAKKKTTTTVETKNEPTENKDNEVRPSTKGQWVWENNPLGEK